MTSPTAGTAAATFGCSHPLQRMRPEQWSAPVVGSLSRRTKSAGPHIIGGPQTQLHPSSRGAIKGATLAGQLAAGPPSFVSGPSRPDTHPAPTSVPICSSALHLCSSSKQVDLWETRFQPAPARGALAIWMLLCSRGMRMGTLQRHIHKSLPLPKQSNITAPQFQASLYSRIAPSTYHCHRQGIHPTQPRRVSATRAPACATEAPRRRHRPANTRKRVMRPCHNQRNLTLPPRRPCCLCRTEPRYRTYTHAGVHRPLALH